VLDLRPDCSFFWFGCGKSELSPSSFARFDYRGASVSVRPDCSFFWFGCGKSERPSRYIVQLASRFHGGWLAVGSAPKLAALAALQASWLARS
jgi:hypothetical protein